MSMGLPGHLRPDNVSRAAASATHTVALVALAITVIVLVGVELQQPERQLWPASLALVPIAVTIGIVHRRHTLVVSVVFVMVAAVCLYGYSLVVMAEYPIGATDSFVLTMPRLAVMLVGGAGASVRSGVLLTTAGLAAADTAIIVAAAQSDIPIVADTTSLTTWALIVLMMILVGYGQRSVRRVQPRLHRAVRDEHLDALRSRLEVKAAGIMHDTVLGDLTAIARSPEGPLTPAVRSQIERDLQVLAAEEWLTEIPDDQSAAGEYRESVVHTAIAESTELGLAVEVSGELSTLGRLAPTVDEALGLAVKQCLVNVLNHAGTDRADVVIYGSDAGVTVMVVDAGMGFSAADTGADRLGLRQSVQSRIESIGGLVRVWSTPGRGTSIMLRVPISERDVATS